MRNRTLFALLGLIVVLLTVQQTWQLHESHPVSRMRTHLWGLFDRSSDSADDMVHTWDDDEGKSDGAPGSTSSSSTGKGEPTTPHPVSACGHTSGACSTALATAPTTRYTWTTTRAKATAPRGIFLFHGQGQPTTPEPSIWESLLAQSRRGRRWSWRTGKAAPTAASCPQRRRRRPWRLWPVDSWAAKSIFDGRARTTASSPQQHPQSEMETVEGATAAAEAAVAAVPVAAAAAAAAAAVVALLFLLLLLLPPAAAATATAPTAAATMDFGKRERSGRGSARCSSSTGACRDTRTR